jgi:cleavage and polyadenylation specificity factor subunit 4
VQLCELSFTKTRHLRNPYNENLPVKVARDCQELEPSVGEQLVALMYSEQDSELMVSPCVAKTCGVFNCWCGRNSIWSGEHFNRLG